MIKTVFLDGGVGRVICALPAIDELSKKHEVTIITPHKDVFLNKNNIYQVYKPEDAYLWENAIQNHKYIVPEPYHDYRFYNYNTHLILSFFDALNLKRPSDVLRPRIVLNKAEIREAKETLNVFKEPGKKLIVFQPFGQGARLNMDIEIDDETNRSLKMETVEKITEALKDKYTFIYIGTILHQRILKNCKFIPNLNLRQIFALINEADAFVGCESMGQHVAFAFNKPGVVILGGTALNPVSYPSQFGIFKKNKFQFKFVPYRLPVNTHVNYNEGCMDFTEKENKELINKISKL